MNKKTKKFMSMIIIMSMLVGQITLAKVSYASNVDQRVEEVQEIIEANSSELSGMFDGLLDNPFIQGIINDVINKIFEGIDVKEALKYLVDSIKDSIDKGIAETIQTIGKTITDTIVGTIVGSIDSIGKNIADTIKHGIDKFIDDGIKNIADNLGTALEGLFGGPIKGIIGGAGEGIGKAIESIINSIKNVTGGTKLGSVDGKIDIAESYKDFQTTLANASEDLTELKATIDNDSNLSDEDKAILNEVVDAAKELLDESDKEIDKSIEDNKEEIDKINDAIDKIDEKAEENDDDKEEETTTEVKFERISGKNRISTAISAAKNAYPEGTKTVILVSGDTFADALSANSLVKKYDAPMVLTNSSKLSAETESYISDNKVENIYIVGGFGSVSEEISKTLEGKEIKVERIAGKDRYDTSLEVLKANIDVKSDDNDIIIANGNVFADALAASSVSTNEGTSIVLTNGKTLDKNISDYIVSSKELIDDVYLIGGKNSVADSVINGIDLETERISGKDRVATSIAIAKKFFDDSYNMVLADGRNFPDALSSGAISMKKSAPIILNDSNSINAQITNFVKTEGIKEIIAIGGENSVPNFTK